MKPEQTTYRSFPDAGYTVIRGEGGLILTFDHGPLGIPPLYNHGHADALSITLSVNSRPLLVDPGTYRYNGVPEFRRYFKGTRAHNTVTVDGEDQAVQETSFIWSRPFRAALVRTSEVGDGMILEGYHDGYKRLNKPVVHHRTVFFFGGRHFLIRDAFSGEGTHDFEMNYHIHPGAVVELKNGWWQVNHGDETGFIRLLAENDFNMITGQENPPLGWFSPAYGIKLKSCVLNYLKRGNSGDVAFLTVISIHSPAGSEEIQEKVGALWKLG